MAVDVEEIVGRENMTLDAHARVQAIIKALPSPVTERRYLYARWLKLVGAPVTPGELDAVGKQ